LQTPGAIDSADYSITVNDLKFRWEWDRSVTTRVFKSCSTRNRESDRFFAELKRRKVYTVAIAYVVAGWALAQGLAQVLPVFDISNWIIRLLVVLIVLGFPVALTLSWFFDLTRYGVVRTPNLREIDVALTPTASENSIAVLPFADLSPNRDHDYLSDGIADEISTALSKIDNLRVAARRSSFWFKDRQADLREVANKLNVAHVLEDQSVAMRVAFGSPRN